MIPQYDFTRSFDSLIPTREVWEGRVMDLVNETIQMAPNLKKQWIEVYFPQILSKLDRRLQKMTKWREKSD